MLEEEDIDMGYDVVKDLSSLRLRVWAVMSAVIRVLCEMGLFYFVCVVLCVVMCVLIYTVCCEPFIRVLC